jgi:site-specific DNA-methyltransferase (adenine-specific)
MDKRIEQIIEGNNIEVLKTFPDNYIDSIVTDPPYELGFMGKKWDSTGIAYNVDLWRECLRVLKPGGHLIAFSGSRTYHRMAVAIEDAGFEIRDQIMWVYGSGFPKSHDISKAIDKMGGVRADFSVFRDKVKEKMKKNKITIKQLSDALGNYMLSHYLTNGSQPATPNYRDYQIIRDFVGLGNEFDDYFSDEAEREVIGQITKARSTNGNSALPTIAGQTIYKTWDETAPATEQAKQWEGWGTALKPAHEPMVLARKPISESTIAENVLKWGTGAINVDGCRIATDENTSRPNGPVGYGFRVKSNGIGGGHNYGRFPANFILDEEASKILDEQTGENVSRFFYVPKASNRDRNSAWNGQEIGLEEKKKNNRKSEGKSVIENGNSFAKNFHPTVKPTELMKYLCRLVTPQNGIVLDIFAGSGSTLVACKQEGYQYIGIEQQPEYIEIIKARLTYDETIETPQETQEQEKQPTLFDWIDENVRPSATID